MLRTTDSRTILLVEGDDDCRLLDPHVDSGQATTLPAGCRSAALTAWRGIDERGIEAVVVLIDRDWETVLSSPLARDGLVRTLHYDIDVDIALSGSVLERLIANHSSRQGRPPTQEILRCALAAAGAVGALRLVSDRYGLGLRTARFPISAVMDASGTVDLRTLAEVAIKRSTSPKHVDIDWLVDAVQQERASFADETLCNGHDLVAVLSALLKLWKGRAGADTLAQGLRSACSRTELAETHVFQQVETWATQRAVRVWREAA